MDDPGHAHQDDTASRGASAHFMREAPEGKEWYGTGTKDPYEDSYVPTDQNSKDDSRFRKQRLQSDRQRWHTVSSPEGTNTKFNAMFY